jgi:uncharacterized protein YecT (DUF1311 family)
LNRNIAFAACVLGLSAGCSSSSHSTPTTPQLPVIQGRFSAMPCPRTRVARGTTIGIEACTGQRVRASNAAIRRNERAVLARLPAGRRQFIVGERAWLAYRNAGCTAWSKRYEGGSLEPVAYVSCLEARNRAHLHDLAPFLKEG